MTAAYHKKIIDIQEAISKSFENLRKNLSKLKSEINTEESVHRKNIEILHTKITSQKKQCQILQKRAKNLKTKQELSKILLGVKNFSKFEFNKDEFDLDNIKASINQKKSGESQVNDGTQTTPRISTTRSFPLPIHEDFIDLGVQTTINSVLLTKKNEMFDFSNAKVEYNDDEEKSRLSVKNLQKQTNYDLKNKKLSRYPKDVEKALSIKENLENFSLEKKSNFDSDSMRRKANFAHQNGKFSETIKSSEGSERQIILLEEEFISNRNDLTQFNEPSNAVINDKILLHDHSDNKSAMMIMERSFSNLADKDQMSMNNGTSTLSRKFDITNVIEETISSKQSSPTNVGENCCNDFNQSSNIEEVKSKIAPVNDKIEFDKLKKDFFNMDLEDNNNSIKKSQISLPSSPKSKQHTFNEIENLNINSFEYNDSLTLLENKIKDDQKKSKFLDKSREGNGDTKTTLLNSKIFDGNLIENEVKFKNGTTQNNQPQQQNSKENVKRRKECSPLSTAYPSEHDKKDIYKKMLSKESENNNYEEHCEFDIAKALSLPTESSAYDVESIDSVEAAIQEATAIRRNSNSFSKRSEMNGNDLSPRRPIQNERVSETVNIDSQESKSLKGKNLLKSTNPIRIRLHSDTDSSIQMSAGGDSFGSEEDDDSQFW